MSQCRSCDAPIIWAKSPAGKAMPIDAEPVPDGNVLLVANGSATPNAIVVEADHQWAEGARRYKSHFATCPNAASHRRSR